MKKICIFIMLLCVCLSFGCENKFDYTPFNVSFKNQTLLGSKSNTIVVVYAEDKRIRDKYTDIFIKTDSQNVQITLQKELTDKRSEFVVPTADKWFSLTALLDDKSDLTTFAKAETTTLIFSTSNPNQIVLKAVGGDMVYHLDSGKYSLDNVFDVSKEFTVNLN